MGNPFIGECRLVGFNFAPQGWAMCAGQTVAIAENDTLFNLLGTTYGGDGQSTFLLPNLQGRTPIHQGTGGGINFTMGQPGGTEGVTLTTSQIPNHTHPLIASGATGSSNNAQNNVLAATVANVYRVSNPKPAAPMNSLALLPQGGSQPHENRQPYLTMTWIISMFGIFPTS